MEKRKLEGIRNTCGFEEGTCGSSSGQSGGIGLWWKDVSVSLISFSQHHILVEVRDSDEVNSTWFACGVYS